MFWRVVFGGGNKTWDEEGGRGLWQWISRGVASGEGDGVDRVNEVGIKMDGGVLFFRWWAELVIGLGSGLGKLLGFGFGIK